VARGSTGPTSAAPSAAGWCGPPRPSPAATWNSLTSCDLSKSSFREADITGANLEGCDLTGCDLFQAVTTGARLSDADLRGAEVSGLNLAGLAAYDGLKINLDQQQALLTALGLDVYAG
jgi:uncharacterized protein YjbI with pentapeptide repeats